MSEQTIKATRPTVHSIKSPSKEKIHEVTGQNQLVAVKVSKKK